MPRKLPQMIGQVYVGDGLMVLWSVVRRLLATVIRSRFLLILVPTTSLSVVMVFVRMTRHQHHARQTAATK